MAAVAAAADAALKTMRRELCDDPAAMLWIEGDRDERLALLHVARISPARAWSDWLELDPLDRDVLRRALRRVWMVNRAWSRVREKREA